VKACNGRQQEHDNTSWAQLMNFVSQLPERPAVLHAPETYTTARMAIAAASKENHRRNIQTTTTTTTKVCYAANYAPQNGEKK
jgi:hypothetical protein